MLLQQKQKYNIPTWTDGLIRGYHGLHPYTGSVLFFTWELWRCMWDQDNYLLAGLHDLTLAPGSDTELPTFQSADQAFHQLLQHNDIADVGKCWCLGPASHCVAEWRRVWLLQPAPTCGQSEWPGTSCLETQEQYYRGEVRGERGEDHTSIINFCLLENSSFSHEKNIRYCQFFVVSQLVFLLAANLDLFINPSLHTFRLQ